MLVSSPASQRLAPAHRQRLLRLARESIAHGLAHGCPLPVNPEDLPPVLQAPGATFVTLKAQGVLRGCIGHLQAVQPLIRDVAENAFAAAFRDPRFPPVTAPELDAIGIEISVLSPPEPLSFRSEAELVACIEPGRDGLILEAGSARGTFLPTVWESLPDPRAFVRELKRKAGLDPSYWSDAIQVSRYRTESFSESSPETVTQKGTGH